MAKRPASLATLSLAMSVIPAMAWAQGTSDGDPYAYGPHMMGWGGAWYGMILGPIFMIIVIAAIVALILVFARSLGGPWHGHPPTASRTPLDILKERFARGEIDKQEYEERRRVLGE